MSDRRPIACPADLLAHLRGGDTLVHCLAHGWRLTRADRPVDAQAAETLLLGGYILDNFGGQLAPGGDCLPGFEPHLSQTWRWAEARSAAKH